MDGPRPDQIHVLFRWFKEGPPGAIPVEATGRSRGLLQAVTWEDAGCEAARNRLIAWHAAAFVPLPRGARPWLVDVLESTDRVLFWVKNLRDESIGLVGLSSLDIERGTIALSDVLCGDLAQQPLLDAAIESLTTWVRQSLKLTVLGSARAVAA